MAWGDLAVAALPSMHAVHHHSTAPRRLIGWITLSALAHLLALAMGSGAAPANAPHARPLMADIRYITPEITSPVAVPGPEPDIETRPPAKEPPPPNTGQKTTTVRTPPGAVVALPFPFDAYYSAHDVDVRAEPSNEVLLFYPLNAYKRRISGMVRVTLLINEFGGLDKVTVVDATPPGIFEEAALEAVNKLQFTAALKNGQQVKSRKTIEVVFDPSEQLSQPAPR
jgi:TonB family protein